LPYASSTAPTRTVVLAGPPLLLLLLLALLLLALLLWAAARWRASRQWRCEGSLASTRALT
jgi:hypothetical protein